VTTRREFCSMVEQFFGNEPPPVPADLAEVVAGLAQQAHRHGIRQLHIETMPGDAPGEIRFQVSGVLTSETRRAD
jgi:hypothetical protein